MTMTLIKLSYNSKLLPGPGLVLQRPLCSAVFSGGAGGARAPPEFGGSEKGRSLISADWSFAITTNTPGFKKLSTLDLRKLDIWGLGSESWFVVASYAFAKMILQSSQILST